MLLLSIRRQSPSWLPQCHQVIWQAPSQPSCCPCRLASIFTAVHYLIISPPSLNAFYFREKHRPSKECYQLPVLHLQIYKHWHLPLPLSLSGKCFLPSTFLLCSRSPSLQLLQVPCLAVINIPLLHRIWDFSPFSCPLPMNNARNPLPFSASGLCIAVLIFSFLILITSWQWMEMQQLPQDHQ